MTANIKLKLIAPVRVEQRKGTATWYAQLVSGLGVIVWAVDTLAKVVSSV